MHAHIESDLGADENQMDKPYAHFTVGAEETRALAFLSPTMVGCGSSDGKLRVFETTGEGTRVFISIGDDSKDILLPIVSLTSSSGAHHQHVVAAAFPTGHVSFYDYQRTSQRVGSYGSRGGFKDSGPQETLRRVEYHPYKDHELLISFGNLFRVIDVRRTSQPVTEIKDFLPPPQLGAPVVR